jgi:hypothetical protein
MRVLHPRSPADWRDAPTMGTVAGGTDVADDVEIAIRRFVESVRGCHWAPRR